MKLVCITALWCPACLIMRPRVEKLKDVFPFIEQIQYDYDFDEEEVNKYQVGKTLPVFILLNNDKEIVRIVGEKAQEELENIIKENIL